MRVTVSGYNNMNDQKKRFERSHGRGIENAARAMKALVQDNLDKRKIDDTGELSRSVDVFKEPGRKYSMWSVAITAEHAAAIEYGTHHTMPPPAKDLLDWVERKVEVRANQTSWQAAHAIARGIAKKGGIYGGMYQGQGYWSDAVDTMEYAYPKIIIDELKRGKFGY